MLYKTVKNANNGLEIRGYIKSRSLLGIKPVDVRREVCDIYGNGQMSHRSVCRLVAKFKIRYKHLKDANRQGRPSTFTTKHYIVEIHQILQKDVIYTLRQLARKI